MIDENEDDPWDEAHWHETMAQLYEMLASAYRHDIPEARRELMAKICLVSARMMRGEYNAAQMDEITAEFERFLELRRPN